MSTLGDTWYSYYCWIAHSFRRYLIDLYVHFGRRYSCSLIAPSLRHSSIGSAPSDASGCKLAQNCAEVARNLARATD